MKRDYTVG